MKDFFIYTIVFSLGLSLFFSSCNEKQKSEVSNDVIPESNQLDNHPSILEVTEKIKIEPNNPKLYFIRSNMRFQLENYSGAKEDLKKCLSLDSTYVQFYIGLADVYFEEKDLTRALNTLEQAVKLDPENESVQLKLGVYKIYMQNYPEAIEHLDIVLKKNIYNAEAYFYKGILFKEIEKRQRSISSFQTAVEINPEYFEAYMQLALLFADEKPELALQYYDNALKINPSSTDALYGKGLLLQNQKDYLAAIELYRSIIINTPQNPNAYYNIGYVYFMMDSLEKADNNFKIASSINPAYADAFYMRGLIQEAIGNFNKAADYYKQSLSLQSEHEASIKGLERIDKKSLK